MTRFFLITFALSWSGFIAATRVSGALQSALILFATITPALVALGLTAWESGSAGLEAFFSRRFTWASISKGAKWYVFAITFFLAVKLMAAIAVRVVYGDWPRFGTEPWYIIVAAIVISTPVQAGEEIGWRGYALPRMAPRFGLGTASVILGIIWSVWHLPIFFLPGADKVGQSFAVYLLGTTTISIAMAWLYGNTNGSLWMTMLMHSAVNQTTGIVPTADPNATGVFALSHAPIAWFTVGLLCVCAAYFLWRMPPARTVT